MRKAISAAAAAALLCAWAQAGVVEVTPETCAAAFEKARPGDVIMLTDGVYKGGMRFTRSANADAPIYIGASGEKAVFDGGDVCLSLEGASYVTVDGIGFQNAATAGMKVRRGDRTKKCSNVTVKNCTFANNKKWGIITSHVEYFSIENCEAFGATIEHGIYVANSGDDNVIRNNRVHDNAGNGIHINGDPEMGGDGVISRALVENNRIWENGKPKGGSALSVMHVQDSLLRNNLMYNNYAAGIVLYWYAGKEDEQSSKNNRIYNNTVFFRPGEGRSCLLLRRTATGNNIRNNIFLGGIRGTVYAEPSCLAGMRCDYNVVANYGAVRLFGDAEEAPTPAVVKDFAKQGMTIETSAGVAIPVAEWKMRGFDVNSVLDRTPEFVNAAKGDLHLAKGSAGVGAGTPISDVTTDIVGTPRPKTGPVDCGCYQTKAAESAHESLHDSEAVIVAVDE